MSATSVHATTVVKDVARDIEKAFKVVVGPNLEVDRHDPDKIKISGKKDATFRDF